MQDDKAAIVDGAASFVAAYEPKHAAALAEVQEWRKNDEELGTDLERVAADLEACGEALGKDCASAVKASKALTATFEPLADAAVGEVEAWAASDIEATDALERSSAEGRQAAQGPTKACQFLAEV